MVHEAKAEEKPLEGGSSSGRHAARERIHPRNWFIRRPRPMHIIVVVVFITFGMALTTQVRSRVQDPLDRLSEQELVTLLGDLQTHEEELLAIRADLQNQLAALEQAATDEQAALEAAQRSATQAQIVAGALPVEGEGITIRIMPSADGLPSNSFVTMLAELRNAGAEAIAVNGNRITGRSWFGDEGGAIVLDGTVLEAPYTWSVIGDAHTLSTALEIRGGASTQLRAFGAAVAVNEYDRIEITSFQQPSDPVWAEVTESS